MSDTEHNIDGEDVDPDSHLRLVKAINTLDKTQHILKPSRDGSSETKSEFHVSKGIKSKSAVAVSDIIKILQDSTEHADTGKRLKTAQRNNRTLRKPLEKHEAAVIKRSTGFEEIKEKLGRWDAIVSRNRTLEHQKFPLTNTSFKQPATKEYLSKFTLKSELENELDELKPVEEEPEEEKFPMTASEMLEYRKEAARLRAKQSYKEAKARRQSKIKSKKFHRIQRKEKIKKQLKDFEGLQKSDPEQALRKLEQLEKTRAEERVTLRHKNTGQWAKNKLVRAKYDKETRQELAEQLAISRNLTQKNEIHEDTESEEELPALVEDASNPWLSKVKPSNEVSDFVSGYKKYWETRNAIQNNIVQNDSPPSTISQDNSPPSINTKEVVSETVKESVKVSFNSKKRKLAKISVKSTAKWDVEALSASENNNTGSQTVDDIFDDLEYKLKTKVSNKLNLFKSEDKTPNPKIEGKKPKASIENSLSYLEFKKNKLRPEIDEEMNETSRNEDSPEENMTEKIVENITLPIPESNKTENINKIDPENFAAIKPRHLQTALPDMDLEGDHMDDDDDIKRITIAEAFEDDDIVAEFQQEKDSDVKKNLPQIEDLSMPGWGSWVGKGIKRSKTRRRFMFNVPKVLPRKDDKKDNVIINETKDSKIKAHQVSELPFPFTSVSDFEATIRAPIGNTFIPETAHKKLIKPAVIVKTGIIIEPMDESQLITKKGKIVLDPKSKTKISKKANKNDSKIKNPVPFKKGNFSISGKKGSFKSKDVAKINKVKKPSQAKKCKNTSTTKA